MNTAVLQCPSRAQTAHAEPEAWAVSTAQGIRLRLPPSMRSLTTYVLLEQERWFEPEMSLLPHLITPEMNALDIGANHGLYTMEMARCALKEGSPNPGDTNSR